VQKEIRQHYDDAVAPVVRCRMPEDALPDLRVANVVAESHESAPTLGVFEINAIK
jgi:hypothetical protein